MTSINVADLVESVLGTDLPIRVQAYDASVTGAPDATTTLVIRSPDALRRIATAPGELGIARAYVAGDIEVRGDIFALLALRDRLPDVRLRARDLVRVVRGLGLRRLRPMPPPPEEARLRGRLHSIGRDARAVSHHYDVSNDFYRLLLGSTMTYSCAVWTDDPADTLDAAQTRKYELICRKLGLGARQGMRLLDVGCGWGGMVMHAAGEHGASAVGVTISRRQAELAEKRVADAGLAGTVEVRLQDYREVDDGPFDAVSSIGMFEHVGEAKLAEYFDRLYQLCAPGARLLNHGISRPPGARHARIGPNSFIGRYVFPDSELHEVGRVVSAVQRAGFEVRHVESLREHYDRTLRCWEANLESHWDECVALVGSARARVWRLYLAGSAMNFAANRTQIHQILAVKPDGSASHMPWRPDW